MGEKTGQRMFIETLSKQYPDRVLKHIRLEYTGFCVLFDLPSERRLQITISAFANDDGTIEVYEHLQGSEPGGYWLIESRRYSRSGVETLPLLESYLRTTIGGIECSYEGSFAEVILAGYRNERQCICGQYAGVRGFAEWDCPVHKHCSTGSFIGILRGPEQGA